MKRSRRTARSAEPKKAAEPKDMAALPKGMVVSHVRLTKGDR